jgi:hypothetical protein
VFFHAGQFATADRPAFPTKPLVLPHLFMRCVLSAFSTEFIDFQALGMFALILGRNVVSILAFAALQRNSFSHELSSSSWISRIPGFPVSPIPTLCSLWADVLVGLFVQ